MSLSKQKTTLSFLFLWSIMSLWGHADNRIIAAEKPVLEQKSNGETQKIYQQPQEALGQYKKYLPYCSAIVKNIARIVFCVDFSLFYAYPSLMYLFFPPTCPTYGKQKMTRLFPLEPLYAAAGSVTFMTALRSFFRDLENPSNDILLHNSSDIKNNTSDKFKKRLDSRIVWHLVKAIAYPFLIISRINQILHCNHNCTRLKHFAQMALVISTGYDTFYKPMTEFIDQYKTVKTQSKDSQKREFSRNCDNTNPSSL